MSFAGDVQGTSGTLIAEHQLNLKAAQEGGNAAEGSTCIKQQARRFCV